MGCAITIVPGSQPIVTLSPIKAALQLFVLRKVKVKKAFSAFNPLKAASLKPAVLTDTMGAGMSESIRGPG